MGDLVGAGVGVPVIAPGTIAWREIHACIEGKRSQVTMNTKGKNANTLRDVCPFAVSRLVFHSAKLNTENSMKNMCNMLQPCLPLLSPACQS